MKEFESAKVLSRTVWLFRDVWKYFMSERGQEGSEWTGVPMRAMKRYIGVSVFYGAFVALLRFADVLCGHANMASLRGISGDEPLVYGQDIGQNSGGCSIGSYGCGEGR